MNSLEALKQIEKELYLLLPKNIRDTLIQTIKQDLERLETLEEENQELIVNKNVAQAIAFDQKREIAELKDQISHLKEESEEWQSAYEWSQAKNSILKLKNQELEEENQKLKKDYNLLDTTMESDDRIICELLKEKEQLSNDIKLNEAQIDDLTLEVANYKHALEEKNEIIMDLKELGVKIGREKYQLDKIIEIIKNKCVSNTNLWLVVCSRNYEDYKSFVENKDHELVRIEHNILTQQEYELLKEVFGNE